MSTTPVNLAIRGNQLDARYGKGGVKSYSYTPNGPTAPLTTTTSGLSGEIGSSSIDVNTANGNGRLVYPGGLNMPLPADGGISFLHRGSFTSLTGSIGVLNIGAAGLSGPCTLSFTISGANFAILVLGENTSSLLNSSVAHGLSTNVINDILLTWDYSASANALKIYVDNSLVGQFTVGGSWTTMAQPPPLIATGAIGVSSKNKINEMIVFPGVINPASVWCGGSQVALNGASRTAFVDCNAFDGTVSVDPGISKVQSGTSYEINGVSLVGTLAGGLSRSRVVNK